MHATHNQDSSSALGDSRSAAHSSAPASTSGTQQFFWYWVCGLLLAGLVCRWLMLAEFFAKNPLFRHTISDPAVYWDWAGRIAQGEIVGETPFLSAPLYPYVLGAIRAIGGGLVSVYVLLLCLHLATASLIALIGRKCFGSVVGLWAMALFLLLAEPAFDSQRMLQGTPQLLLVCMLWWQLQRLEGRPTWPGHALAGGLLGLNCLTQPALMLLLPVMPVWSALQVPRLSLRLTCAASLLGGALLVISPATIHNWKVAAEFIPVSSHAGITLRQGNAPRSFGIYTPLPGISNERDMMHVQSARVFQNATGETPSFRAVDAYFRGEALDFWRSDPGRAVTLAAKKLYLFCTAKDYHDIFEPTAERRTGIGSRMILAPLATPWVLWPALVGLVVLLRRPVRNGPALMLFAVPLFVVVVFWYSPRYRLPSVPVIAVVGAWALHQLIHWRNHRAMSLCVVAAVLVGGLASSFQRAAGDVRPQPGRLAMQLGDVTQASGELDEAVSYFQEAVGYASQEFNAQVALADVYRRQGKTALARQHFAQAFELNPAVVQTHPDLAFALLDSQTPANTLEHFRSLARRSPKIPAAHVNFGMALLGNGRPGEALAEFQTAIDLDPSLVVAHHNQGVALTSLGRADEAMESYRNAIRLKSDFDTAHINLGAILYGAGRYDEAAVHFEAAVGANPDNALGHRNLAAAFVQLGRLEDAVTQYRHALRQAPSDAAARTGLDSVLARLQTSGSEP